MEEQKAVRNSGIELMKILAIILIVVSHVIQTLYSENTYVSSTEYMLNLNLATTSLQTFILIVLQHSGKLGNSIFFLCSAWFLLESNHVNRKKILTIILEMWSISVVMLMAAFLVKGNGISMKLVIKSFFPFFFAVNWYVGCYVIFYAIHPLLNQCITSLSQGGLLKIASIAGVLYCGCNCICTSFYSSELILWIALYFMTAYLKKYLPKFCNSMKANIFFLLCGIAGNISLILVTNALGMHIAFFENQLLHWNKNCNPLLVLTAFALFNIGRNICFKSEFVNYISGMSLLIYIIHENLFVRTYIRPYLWEYVHESFGYDYILGWLFVLSVAIFAVSFLLSILYKNTLQRFIVYIIPKLYQMIGRIYKKYEQTIMRWN